MTIAVEYYDIKQAATVCGYSSTHMIDYLCREDLIFPCAENSRGRGRKRYFSFQDLLTLKIYKRLFDAGVSVKRLKEGLKESREFSTLRASRDYLKNKNGEANVLFTDGKNVYVKKNREAFIQAGTRGQFVFSFMISLEDLHTELANETLNVLKYRQRPDGKSFYKEKVTKISI